MRLRKLPVRFVLLCVAAGMSLRAQGPLNPPVPLTTAQGTAQAASPGSNVASLAAAQQAQEYGFPSIAIGIYRQLLAAPGGDQGALTNALATALIDDGQPAEADKVLQSFTGTRGSAWHLRAGLAVVQAKKVEVMRAELAAIRQDELSPADAAWAAFLQGAIFDLQTPQDTTKANEFYTKAETSAPNEMARSRFKLAGEQVRMSLNAPSDATRRQAQLNYEANRGRPMGPEFAKTYALALFQGGKREDATKFLQGALLTMLPQERKEADKLRLVLGMIADKAAGGAGRVALMQLLAPGGDTLLQRVALQLLARASTDEVLRGVFRAELNKLIDVPTKHPILESLLLVRAQVALADRDYAQAEKDTRKLLEDYPGSPYRANAFGVLTASTWEQRRYRAAADNARKARAELPPEATQGRGELMVLEAEAWFRAGSAGDAGDFRSAADAYAAAQKEHPASVKTGDMMFQRVLSEIKAGALDTAQPLLDELGRDPGFDIENRWRAEWNLSRALRVQGDAGARQAYARVNTLLGEKITDAAPSPNSLPPDLRARMAWLQASLALEAKEPERTIKLADDMGALLTGLDEGLRSEIASTAALLRAEANFQLDRETEALATLKQLREDPKFAKSGAAVQSYLIEAAHYASQDKAVEAQKLYTRLAEEFQTDERAPYALFQAALQAERRGQDVHYKEANQLIEDLVRKYPGNELVFSARLKQGDIYRRLNDLPAAQQAYDDLLNKPASQENLILAQLALAECHNAQSAGDPAHFDKAQTLFEHLLDRVDASADVRVEAGYNLGELWVRRNNPAKALEIWWKEVITNFLLDEKRLAELQSTGRHWLAVTLFRAGEIYEKQGRLEEAKAAWLMQVKAHLGGEETAKAKLQQFGLPEGKP